MTKFIVEHRDPYKPTAQYIVDADTQALAKAQASQNNNIDPNNLIVLDENGNNIRHQEETEKFYTGCGFLFLIIFCIVGGVVFFISSLIG